MQTCTYRGWGSSNCMGIREVSDIRNGLSEPFSGYRPRTTKGTIRRLGPQQNLKSLIIQTKRKDSQVQIYHPALLWEVAQSLRCCFSQPTSHLAGTPKWIPDWTLPIRHHRVWWHGRLGQIDNSIIIIRGKRQYSAHLTRRYPCSWTQWPAIQKN